MSLPSMTELFEFLLEGDELVQYLRHTAAGTGRIDMNDLDALQGLHELTELIDDVGPRDGCIFIEYRWHLPLFLEIGTEEL